MHKSLNIYNYTNIKKTINLEFLKYNKLYKYLYQENEKLFNKLIKTKFFKFIINKYSLNKYREIVYNYFHEIFLFCLFNNNSKIQHFNIIGIKQYSNEWQNLKIIKLSNDAKQKIGDSIFYINFLFEYTNDTFTSKKYALNEFYGVLSLIYNKFNKFSNNSMKLIEKFKISKYINISDKTDLNFYYKSLIN